jgi:TetR/AcrR family transcriptional regulator, transcriptional repressor for nem operon
MRYSVDHKNQTREKIVRAASRRFRSGGAKGVAIADLMRELRLTHGGFYKHFSSKEQLFAEAMRQSFEDGAVFILEGAKNAPKGQELKAIIETYLSVYHCENPSEGCPVTSLASEMGTHPKAVRIAFDQAFSEYASRLASKYITGKTEKERFSKALVLFTGMAGAISCARAVKDNNLRDTILKSARDSYIQAFCSA